MSQSKHKTKQKSTDVRKYDALDMALSALIGIFLTLVVLQLAFVHISGISQTSNNLLNKNLTIAQNVDSYATLTTAASKYVNETMPFFKYNLSNKDKTMTIEDLKEQGGACVQWSNYYRNLATKDGFLATTPSFDTNYENNKLVGHEIAIISNAYGYCIIDQTEYVCWDFAK